jgi:hypothetical protein
MANGEQKNPARWNQYAYALSDPANFHDPSGLNAEIPGFCSAEFENCGGGGDGFLGGGDPGGGGGGGGIDPCGWDNFLANPACIVPMPAVIIATPPPPKKEDATLGICTGSARVLQGNGATIGKPGGFSGSTVGDFYVTPFGAAVIPSQWATDTAALRPYVNSVGGVFPLVDYSFFGLVDTIGGAPPPGVPPGTKVQPGLMMLNPGKLILELPGAPRDFGTTAVALTLPLELGCPDGTHFVGELH